MLIHDQTQVQDRPAASFRPPMRRALALVGALGVLAFISSCSLILDLEQCASDADCPSAGVCSDGLCKLPQTVEVINHITEDTTWKADTIYVLKDVITVASPRVLTIEPGTRILGERGSALVSLAGARIEAVGTRENPIVFTSAQPVGRRRAGDWGGVALIGKARVNRDNFGLRINDEEQHPLVGGSDDSWNCGTIKYVRIEFGGGKVAGDNALNGLTLAGCGTKTTVDYMQAHLGDDDNLEIFGGSVHVRHIVLTRASDDPFDIDTGWHGSAQFLAIQQDPIGNNSLEIGGLQENHDALPRTNPKIYNYTIIGAAGDGDTQRAAHIKEGASAFLSHGIIMGHHTNGIEVANKSSIDLANQDKTVVQHTLFFEVGANKNTNFTDTCAFIDPENKNPCDPANIADPAAVVEFAATAYFTQSKFHNVFGKDPGFERPYDLTNPSWVPSPANTTGDGIPSPPASEGFDPTGVYLGAFRPGEIPWTEGWTDYPSN